MKLSVRTSIVSGFLLFALTAFAADLTWNAEFENALYNTPKGWATTQKNGSQMLIPGDLAPGEQVAIVLTPGGELTGELKDALNQFRGELRGNVKATESKIESINSDEGYPIVYVAEQLQDEKGAVKQYRYFFASHPGSRVEFVVFIANTQDVYTRYGKTFEEFVKTLAYKNARPGAHATSAPTTAPSSQK
jgi:hypothetical protein